MPPGYAVVEAALPQDVVPVGTIPYVGLRRAIADLLTGDDGRGIPPRTPEQVVARINRCWHQPRSAGAGPVRSPQAWLAAAILVQDCADPGCEDGLLLDSGLPCRACGERRAEQELVRRALADMQAAWEAEGEPEVRATAVPAQAPRTEDGGWAPPEHRPVRRCLECGTPHRTGNILGLCRDCAADAAASG
jgi:ribosomal protein S14